MTRVRGLAALIPSCVRDGSPEGRDAAWRLGAQPDSPTPQGRRPIKLIPKFYAVQIRRLLVPSVLPIALRSTRRPGSSI